MSDSEASRTEDRERQELARLETAVGRLLEESARLRSRVLDAEAKSRDLEALLRRLSKGEEDPVQLQSRLTRIQAENHELRERVRKGREGVERLLARIRFLENRR